MKFSISIGKYHASWAHSIVSQLLFVCIYFVCSKISCPLRHGLSGPNLSYEVRFKDALNSKKPQGAMADLVSFVKQQHETTKKVNQPCSGIIYVHKREDCQALATQICKVRLMKNDVFSDAVLVNL